MTSPWDIDELSARARELYVSTGRLYPSISPRERMADGHVGEDCAFNFMYDNSPVKNSAELATELWHLDYSPVIHQFRARSLDRVQHHSSKALFLFTFKDTAAALVHVRPTGRWKLINPADLLYEDLKRAGMLTATGVIGGTIDYCASCSNSFQHPPYNRPLEYCPNCGAPTFFSAGSQTNQSIGNPPVMPGTDSLAPTIAMRCPGGCGSEIKAFPASPNGPSPVISPCPYGCKVRVELWNKKVDEARKK